MRKQDETADSIGRYIRTRHAIYWREIVRGGPALIRKSRGRKTSLPSSGIIVLSELFDKPPGQ